MAKLDVAWGGNGYKFALDACDAAKRGIEDNSDARGFVWLPVSWAGAQRCGVLWSGDQKLSLGLHPLADPDVRRGDDVRDRLQHR